MRFDRMTGRSRSIAAGLAAGALLAGAAQAQAPDPRVWLRAGWTDAGVAARGMELVANHPRPAGFFNPEQPGDFSVMSSNLALRGNHVYVGCFNGFHIFDVT